MILADHDIEWALGINTTAPSPIAHANIERGSLGIEPQGFADVHVQPASYDLRLGSIITRYYRRPASYWQAVDAWEGIPAEDIHRVDCSEAGYFRIRAGEFLLGHTREHITLPANLCARVEGRSSLGRLGITMHVTAGYIDPGFSGQITLEIANLSSRDVRLRIGDRCCQLVFELMTASAKRPYGAARGSRFVGEKARGPVPIIKGE